nr:MAG TPA: repressor domain protein [Caudoviricetes sp.]
MFVASDVAKALGYSRPADAITAHCKGSVKHRLPTNGGMQELKIIPEGDVYRLITHSKLPAAEKFESWVFDEVLPSIRKHGAYMTEDTIKKAMTEPDFIIKLATELKKEQEQNKQLTETCSQQQQVIGELKPKADYVDKILKSNSLVTITQIAKDYGMSGQGMNKVLHDLHIIYSCNKQWLLYSQHQAKGYTFSETVDIPREDGTTKVVMNTKWTQKRQVVLV